MSKSDTRPEIDEMVTALEGAATIIDRLLASPAHSLMMPDLYNDAEAQARRIRRLLASAQAVQS